MSAADRQAVFLSYASQDAETAARICEALRAAGIEVWFDQNELAGGDAWDAKIRKQIAKCGLFVPVISAATQARREGYFRIEWKLAAQRTYAMADGTPFLLPVVIDATKDSDALVPAEFKAVQWTRLPGGETPEKFCARVKALLGGDVGPVADRAPTQRAGLQPHPALPHQKVSSRPRLALGALAVLIVGAALYFALRPRRSPEEFSRVIESAKETGAKAVAAKSTLLLFEARQLTARALALMTKTGFTREDLAVAEDFAKGATDKEPGNAAAWGVRAGVQSAWIFRNWDTSEKRRQDTQALANKALRSTPTSPRRSSRSATCCGRKAPSIRPPRTCGGRWRRIRTMSGSRGRSASRS